MANSDTNGGGGGATVSISFRAKARGQQFLVRLRAVKHSYGLLQSPFPLKKGELLALQPTGYSEAGYDKLQLFASVQREHDRKDMFVVSWAKLMCPTGTTRILDFLQNAFGIRLDWELDADDLVEGQMVYFEFGTMSLLAPGHGKLDASFSFSGEPTLRTGAVAAGPTEQPEAEPEPAPAADPQEQQPQAQAAPEPAPEPEPVVPPKEKLGEVGADGMVEMFGLKVSAAAWESLDNLGTKHTDDKTGATKVSQAASKQQTEQPPPAEQSNGAVNGNGNGEKPKKMSNLLRRLATKLAGKDD